MWHFLLFIIKIFRLYNFLGIFIPQDIFKPKIRTKFSNISHCTYQTPNIPVATLTCSLIFLHIAIVTNVIWITSATVFYIFSFFLHEICCNLQLSTSIIIPSNSYALKMFLTFHVIFLFIIILTPFCPEGFFHNRKLLCFLRQDVRIHTNRLLNQICYIRKSFNISTSSCSDRNDTQSCRAMMPFDLIVTLLADARVVWKNSVHPPL